MLYRSSAELELGASRCWNDLGFVEAGGEPLSDHPAVGVSMSWRRHHEPLVARRGQP